MGNYFGAIKKKKSAVKRAKAQGKLKKTFIGMDRAQTVGRTEKGARESRDVQSVGKVANRTAVSTGSQRVQVEPKQEGKGSFSRDQIAWLCA